MKKFYVLIFCLLLNSLFSQNDPKNFLIEFYNKPDNPNTIYDISSSASGIQFFGSTNGILKFDGNRWATIKNSFETFSVKNHDGYVFAAGNGKFGKWVKDVYGNYKYNSIYNKTPKNNDYLLPVFNNIIAIKDKIYFKNYAYVYEYNSKLNRLDSIKAKEGFIKIFNVNNRLFAEDVNHGLYRKEKSAMIPIIESYEQIKDIQNIFEVDENSFLVITSQNGIWQLTDDSLNKIAPLNNLKITCAEETNEFYILGSNSRGLIFMRKDNLSVSYNLTSMDGLESNYVGDIKKDNHDNIWVTNEKGVHYIRTSSNINYIKDSGNHGTVYDFLNYKNNFYIGTNQGLFKKSINSGESFKIIKGTEGQVWSISLIENQILVGHDDKGIFSLNKNDINKITDYKGNWLFLKHPNNENILYCGNYNGINILEKKNNKWQYKKRLDNFYESSRIMTFYNNYLWVNHPAKGYFKIDLDDSYQTAKEVKFINNKQYENDFQFFTKLNNELIFFDQSNFFKYDITDDVFHKSLVPESIFKDPNIFAIQQIDQNLWYTTDSKVGIVKFEKNNNEFVITNPLKTVKINTLNDFTKFKKISENQVGVNTYQGVYVVDVDKQNSITNIKKPIINSVSFIGINDSIIAPINENEIKEIPFSNNSISVEFSIPDKHLFKNYAIQYQIDENTAWNTLKNKSELQLVGLKNKNYKLNFRITDNENNFSETSSYAFSINPPWYKSNEALYTYLIIILFIYGISYYFFESRNKFETKRILVKELEKRKSQKQQFELEKLKTEKKLIAITKEKLELQIEQENNELAYSTYSNIQKNELLVELKNEIERLKKLKDSNISKLLKSFEKKINKELNDDNDWIKFEYHFKKAHPNFFKNLSNRHPKLTANDVRLCAFIKLNLSTKEAAYLLNINVRSLEMARYRLRKKLDIDKSIRLFNYINTI